MTRAQLIEAVATVVDERDRLRRDLEAPPALERVEHERLRQRVAKLERYLVITHDGIVCRSDERDLVRNMSRAIVASFPELFEVPA